MGKNEHSFLSILLKSQIFIPLKLGRLGGNKIRFNELFTKKSQNSPLYLTLYFKIGV